MALRDPVAIFTASSNARAQILCQVLRQSGMEAHVTEDFSLAGLWMGGTLPGVHQPQVWVDRADAAQAATVLEEHQRREAELRPDQSPDGPPGMIEAPCEECGQVSHFPATQRGSVQECPGCGGFVDVPDEESPEWHAEAEGEAEGTEGEPAAE